MTRAPMVMLIVLLTYCSSSFADLFEHTPPQQVIAGETLNLVLRLSAELPTETTVSIINPKADMTLTRMTLGKYLLRWNTPRSLQTEQIITVQALFAVSPARVEKHSIVVQPGNFQKTDSSTPATYETFDNRLSALNPASYARPRIKGISTQIISAGKVVKFRIVAPIENGRNADISVAGLPQNAYIDTGNDGFPVFVWDTRGIAQGEYRVAFTATHPSMADLQDTAEAIVIVENSTTSEASDITEISELPQTLEEPPVSYPIESPPGYLPENQPGYPTDAPPGSSPDYPPGLPLDSPPGYSPNNQPGDPIDNSPTGYFPGPQSSGAVSPPPQ